MSSRNFRCPIDGRSFATARALQQHRSASHSTSKKGGKRTQGTPSGVPKMPMNQMKGIFSGSDLIGSVVITENHKAGQLMMMWDINPMTLPTTRMSRLAQVYARWRPIKLHLEVVPGAGVFTPGAYSIGWVAEPGWNPGTGSTVLGRIATLTPSLMSTFGAPKVLKIPCDTTQKWYLTQGGVGIESDHGTVVAALAALIGVAKVSINFMLNWTIEFDSPDIPLPEEDLEAYPDPDWIPIFTDSVSDWAQGKRLTFKHTQGGAVVPFHGLREQVVYQPAKGVKVTYKKGSTDTEVKWFSKMINEPLYSAAMVCHGSEADAKAYQQTGNVDKVLEYSAAGEYVTPTFPEFVGKAVADDVGLDLRRGTVLRARPMHPSLLTRDFQASGSGSLEHPQDFHSEPRPLDLG